MGRTEDSHHARLRPAHADAAALLRCEPELLAQDVELPPRFASEEDGTPRRDAHADAAALRLGEDA
jgi:hypothetical protein